MSFQKSISWLSGNNNLTEINRIYNISCFIGMLFCFLAAVECIFASLSPILIANNFFYALVLAFLFYLSRFRQKFGASRFLSIFVLLFVYTPILWVYNGGSASGIPYYILLFSSFLTVVAIGKNNTQNTMILSWIILVVFSVIVTVLILFELLRPGLFYKFENQSVRYFDMIISMLFALTSNYFILRAFIEQYYKQLNNVKNYSEKLEELVTRDSMTNLYNHGFIVSRLSEEINKAVRYQRSLSILMLDIDHFKQINDTYGHSFGDEVLVKVARAIQSSCRSVDIVARYGGEEFLIVLPETNALSAVITANRLAGLVCKIQFSNEITVTLSGGITQHKAGDTTATIIDRADSLLYEAKNEGRNRIKMV